MSKYIDADKFAERIKLSPAFKNMAFEGDLLQRVVLDILGNAPTADVAEVKHGEWIDDIQKFSSPAGVTQKYLVGYKCSLCGRTERIKEPYCNCGAKMDGGDAE